MIDPNFDPLEELTVLKHNQYQLIKGHNHLDTAMTDVVKHMNDILPLIRRLQQQVGLLEAEIALLKMQQTK